MSEPNNIDKKKTSTGEALKTINNLIGAICAFLCVWAFNSINTKLDKFQDFYEKDLVIHNNFENRITILEKQLSNSDGKSKLPDTKPVATSFVLNKPEDQYEFTQKNIPHFQ